MTNLKKIITIILVTLFTSVSLFAAVEKLETKTFKAKSGGQLKVETDKGSITVKTHPQESIDVEILFKVKTEDEELADDLRFRDLDGGLLAEIPPSVQQFMPLDVERR